jgi:hypothetical protein
MNRIAIALILALPIAAQENAPHAMTKEDLAKKQYTNEQVAVFAATVFACGTLQGGFDVVNSQRKNVNNTPSVNEQLDALLNRSRSLWISTRCAERKAEINQMLRIMANPQLRALPASDIEKP